MTDDDETSWHLDKKIPIAFIVFFIVQTITLVYIGASWKTEVDGRITRLEAVDKERETHESRIIIMEQTGLFVRQSLERIEQKLERIAP